MAKKKDDVLTEREYGAWHHVFMLIEAAIRVSDNQSRDKSNAAPLRRLEGYERNAWIAAREPILKRIRKYQEVTSGDKEAGL